MLYKKQVFSQPITPEKLRSYPAELVKAETPEVGSIMSQRVSMNNYLPEMLSIKKAVELTNCSYEFLRHLCTSGKVKHIRSGRKYLINSNSLAEYLNNCDLDSPGVD